MSATEPAEQAMPGEATATTEIVKRAAASPHALAHMPLMTDDEIRRSWRLASSLAASGMFKDARQAEQAFAKLLLGRDLGLSPTQSMTGIHIVEGKPEVAAVMMGTFVRSRDGYDYRPAWIKETPAARQGERAVREVVYFDEDVASDLRPVVGVAIEFTVDGEMRGVSSFTAEDAGRAGLAAKKNYQGYPRNMYFARAMSNGCKWIVPEVLAGLPVYVEGEIEAQTALDAGEGDGQPQGLDLGPDVEAVIEQAAEMGHAALSDRATIEMQLGQQSPGYVAAWVKAARKELAAMPQDAEVVPDAQGGDLGREKPQAGVPASEAANGREEPAQAVEAVGPDEPPDDPLHDRPQPLLATDPERIAALRRRGEELLAAAEAAEYAGDDRAALEYHAEFEVVAAQVEAAGDANQSSLAI